MTSIARWLYAFVALSESPIGLGKPVLDIFEESISVISNDVDQYYNKKPPRQQERVAKDEKDFFHDIADVRGELSMMRSVVAHQEQVWAASKARLLLLIEHLDSELELPHRKEAHTKAGSKKNKAEAEDMPWTLRLYLDLRANADQIIHETSSLLQRLKDRIDKVDQDAERVQNLVPQYLELKRSYASIKESYYTAIPGAAVFGLSVVTIIFTPLSFALALVALPRNGVFIGSADDKTRFVAEVAGKTEGATLGLTLLVASMAVWWFRGASGLRGDKHKNKVEEAEKKIGDSNVVMIGSSGHRAGSSRGASGFKKPSGDLTRRFPRAKGYLSGDVEQGLGVGVGSS